MISLKTAVGRLITEKHGQGVVPEDAYTGSTSSASNGLAELAVKEVKAKVRNMLHSLKGFLGAEVPVGSAALAWLVIWIGGVGKFGWGGL